MSDYDVTYVYDDVTYVYDDVTYDVTHTRTHAHTHTPTGVRASSDREDSAELQVLSDSR